ncbi:hypothetical protein LGV59_21120 [Bacteroides fragilis]|nr:hypothetical protein [Bacteroides fragilis]
MKRWTEENPNPHAAYPRIYSASSVHTTYNRNFSDYHLFDSDCSVSKLCHWDSTICNSEELGDYSH